MEEKALMKIAEAIAQGTPEAMELARLYIWLNSEVITGLIVAVVIVGTFVAALCVLTRE